MVSLNRATIITELPHEWPNRSVWIGAWEIHAAPVPKWSLEVARERVRFHIFADRIGDSEPYLLLGRRVCAAFGLPKDAEWFDWYAVAEHRHTMIPVPVRSRQTEFMKLVEDLATGRLPDLGYKIKNEEE